MNAMQVFKHTEFGEIGVIEIDGKPYFPSTDCARVLGYKNPHDAVIRHCKTDGVVKHEGVSHTTNQHGVTTEQKVKMNYISEGNLYRLIAHSELPAAERFEQWVFDTVLPSIRKHGGYAGGGETERVVRTAMAAVMAQMPAIVAEAVKAALGAASAPEKPKRRRINYHGKLDRLPLELRNEVVALIFQKQYTYLQVSDYLKERDVDVHMSSVARFMNRLAADVDRLGGVTIET